MNLRTMMQTGPAKANDLFARLSDTSEGAVKTRERLFAELKTELELHASLEEQHLFPILRKHAETKELVAEAIRDNKDLRAKLAELDGLPKNDEAFLSKLAELQKAFRQHARDEKRELLPAVQRALSEEEVQTVAGKIETGLAEAEQARTDQLEERRAKARQEREEAERQAQREEAEEQARTEAARSLAAATAQPAELAGEMVEDARRMGAAALRTGSAVVRETERVATRAAMPGFFFWDWMLPSLPASQPGRSIQGRADRHSGAEEVIPLGEEVLNVSKRRENRGVTRVHRYVVETPAEQQVSLHHERVVVERRRPVRNEATGEVLTERTVEVTETAEVPVVSKTVRTREEIVVRVEVTEQVETVRDTVRRDEVQIEQPGRNRLRGRRAETV
jgi:stress response protein YsnF